MKYCSLKKQENCPVLVVEPTSSVRQMIVDVLKDLGFSSVQGVPTSKEALHYLEVEKVGWLITSLFQNEKCNAIHLLKIITQNSSLFGVTTSLLIEPTEEKFCLSKAFELGLMSYHKKSYVKEDFSTDFEGLLKILKIHQWNATLCSAHFIRGHLKSGPFLRSRKALEQNLLSLFPGSASVLFHLAEAEFLLDNPTEAISITEQVKLIDEKMTSSCDLLVKKYTDDPEDRDFVEERKNVLAINSVLIVDPDTDIHYHCSDLLNKAGISDIVCFESGEAAYNYLSTNIEPDLILMEWRIPELSGPVLVQRIRQLGFIQVPIVVISSLLKPQDIHLLREMGVDVCLDKPFDHNSFFSTVIWAIQQNKNPTEQKSLNLKIRRLLSANKISEAERLMHYLYEDVRVSDGLLLEIEAEYHFCLQNFVLARDKGIEAIKHNGDSLLMLNLIGKSMLKLKQFKGALKAFEKANSISSLNIERLIHIAEASIHLDEHQKAQSILDLVDEIDPSSDQVRDVKCKVSIETGDIHTAKSLMTDIESGKGVISYMNNRAVSLAVSGRFEDGISLYKKTIDSLPETWKDIKASVYYNLALAHARYGDLKQSLSVVEQISDGADTTIKKSIALKNRLLNSIEKGTALEISTYDQLQEEKSESAEKSDDNAQEKQISNEMKSTAIEQILIDIEAKRGDIACYLVFYAIEDNSQDAEKLLESIPNFKKRDVIKREESFQRQQAKKIS